MALNLHHSGKRFLSFLQLGRNENEKRGELSEQSGKKEKEEEDERVELTWINEAFGGNGSQSVSNAGRPRNKGVSRLDQLRILYRFQSPHNWVGNAKLASKHAWLGWHWTFFPPQEVLSIHFLLYSPFSSSLPSQLTSSAGHQADSSSNLKPKLWLFKKCQMWFLPTTTYTRERLLQASLELQSLHAWTNLSCKVRRRLLPLKYKRQAG